jgi:hypothetical protein
MTVGSSSVARAAGRGAETLESLGWTSPDAGADADDADGCSGPGGS